MIEFPKEYFSEDHKKWLISMIPKCLSEAKDHKLKYGDLLFALYQKGFVYPYDDITEILQSVMEGDDRVFWEYVGKDLVFHLHEGKYNPAIEETPPTPYLYRLPLEGDSTT